MVSLLRGTNYFSTSSIATSLSETPPKHTSADWLRLLYSVDVDNLLISLSETAGCQPLRLASHYRMGDGLVFILINPCYLIVCQHYHVGVEQVMGIEPTSNPWQGLIITIILYLHLISLTSPTIVCPYGRLRVICVRLWCLRSESNQQTSGFSDQRSDHTYELLRHIVLVGRERVELPEPEDNCFTDSPATTYGIPSHRDDHQSLFTLVPCYLVVGLGDLFAFLSPLEPLKLYEGVVQGA